MLFTKAALALGTAFVITTTAAAWQLYANRTSIRLVFAPPDLPDLVNALKAGGGDGRVFFTGFILHDYGATHYDTQDGGHVAPLAAFSGKPMYASHYYHAYWSTVDPIPAPYRRGEEKIEEFLDLMNVTSVVTFRKEWRRYCKNNPRYELIWKSGRFRLFKRLVTPNWFVRGEGEVLPAHEGFRVRPRSPDSVLKFRYHPGLRTDRPDIAELYPVPAFDQEVGGGKTLPFAFVGLRVKPEAADGSAVIHIGYTLEK